MIEHSEAWKEGYDDFTVGGNNPYDEGTTAWNDWEAGRDQAEQDEDAAAEDDENEEE